MGSTRFPGKSMKFLNKNFRLIDFVIINALKSKFLTKKNIYLLTSNKKNNAILINHVKKNYNINIIARSESNVFSRYMYFKNHKPFIFLRLTADNPLVDPLLIDKFIEYFMELKSDYMTTRAMSHSKQWKVKSDYPKGISLEIFKSKKLFINKKKFNSKNFQYPTWFFLKKSPKIKIKKFKTFGLYKKLSVKNSFTVDTREDYLNVKNFIKKHQCKPGQNNIYHSLL